MTPVTAPNRTLANPSNAERKACPVCERVFTPVMQWRQVCSLSCYEAAQASPRCLRCGKDFQVSHANRAYCSKSCREAYTETRREKRKLAMRERRAKAPMPS
jgi:predicted nucleic acid-binding Zn ribbon protein